MDCFRLAVAPLSNLPRDTIALQQAPPGLAPAVRITHSYAAADHAPSAMRGGITSGPSAMRGGSFAYPGGAEGGYPGDSNPDPNPNPNPNPLTLILTLTLALT